MPGRTPSKEAGRSHQRRAVNTQEMVHCQTGACPHMRRPVARLAGNSALTLIVFALTLALVWAPMLALVVPVFALALVLAFPLHQAGRQ